MTNSDISNARECANAMYGHPGYLSLLVFLQKRARETKSALVSTHEHMAHIQSGRESAIGWLETEIEFLVNTVPPERTPKRETISDPDLSLEQSPATKQQTTQDDPYNL